jgi:hypothetical protein
MTQTINEINRKSLIVVGGRQRKNALDLNEWRAYETAIIAVVDTTTGKAEIVVEYQSPPEVCTENHPAIVFKAGDRRKDRLLVCTQTELIEFNCTNWQIIHYVTHPWLNDVHHVCYGDENSLMVANTGLDLVLKMDRTGTILKSWNAGKSSTWNRFDQSVDYRRVATTKPHEAHVNFVFRADDFWWSTRFNNQDAMRLDDSSIRLKIPTGNPHEGLVTSEGVYFSTTNGTIVGFDADTRIEIARYNLNRRPESSQILGWCRGMYFDKPDLVWIGFSRIRPTRIRKNLSWIKQGFRHLGTYGTLPTRIALYDLNREELLREVVLERIGLNAVFGIYPLENK